LDDTFSVTDSSEGVVACKEDEILLAFWFAVLLVAGKNDGFKDRGLATRAFTEEALCVKNV